MEKPGWVLKRFLNEIVNRIPPPKGDPDAPLQALIFDSVFNSFRGIIAYFKIVNGKSGKKTLVKFVATRKEYNADEIGVLKLGLVAREMSYQQAMLDILFQG